MGPLVRKYHTGPRLWLSARHAGPAVLRLPAEPRGLPPAGQGRPRGSVAPSCCTTAQPLYTNLASIIGASVSETTMRPFLGRPRGRRAARPAWQRGRGGSRRPLEPAQLRCTSMGRTWAHGPWAPWAMSAHGPHCRHRPRSTGMPADPRRNLVYSTGRGASVPTVWPAFLGSGGQARAGSARRRAADAPGALTTRAFCHSPSFVLFSMENRYRGKKSC